MSVKYYLTHPFLRYSSYGIRYTRSSGPVTVSLSIFIEDDADVEFRMLTPNSHKLAAISRTQITFTFDIDLPPRSLDNEIRYIVSGQDIWYVFAFVLKSNLSPT